MRNYIILNDQNSNDISGLLIQSLAPISKPLMRTEIEEIDGRDGDITTKLGYSAYDKQITIGLFGNYDVDQVIAFFNSEGTAIFSNEPNKYYNYQIVDQIDFERLVRYKTATVTMHCQPFKYSTTEGADILSSSDNFATLNQSLNTDSGFYTYSSNVQADITATRQSGTGGKFFAVFTVPVVQGVNYHFSGNVSRNVSMYGYTDQLRGTSAGIAGKGFNGNFVYTATFTGTMVLGFYSNATTEIFIRNFAISNEASTTISDEGTNLVLEGTGEAPFSQFDLKGNTEQDGTPTPSAPQSVKVVTGENVVKICGKNLADINSNLRSSSNGLVFTANSDGSFTMAGTTTTTWANITNDFSTNLPAGEYTFSIGAVLTHRVYLHCVLEDGSSTDWVINSGFTSVSRTFTSGIKTIRLDVSMMTSGQAYNETIKVQLELGSSASSFEPYQSQSYEINLGKNLLDMTTLTAGYVNGTNGTITVSQTQGEMASGFIKVEPNTSYTFSIQATTGTSPAWFGTGEYTIADASGFLLRKVEQTTGATSQTFTTGANTHFVRLSARNMVGATKVQFEIGRQVSDYAPYFTPIELCKIGTYQDYIYKSGGDWYVHKAVGKYTFTTSETVSYQSNFPRFMVNFSHGQDAAAGVVVLAKSTHFVIGQTASVDGTFGIAANVIYLHNNAITSADDLKTWFGNNNVSVYFALATPTDTKITNAALIEQLNDIADHAHAYKKRTHVSSTYADGNVPHIIAAAVTGDADGTVTNSGNIYSKPKLTIFGTGDIGVYLNGVQMFQIALGTSGYITIDTALMEAYQDNLQTLMNRQVTGDYSNFVLNPGENTISFTGSVSMCVVENYSRWL